MSKSSISIICFLIIVGCNPSKTVLNKTYRNSIPIVDFCDLPKFLKQQVYIKCYYSGVDEYWSLNMGAKKCIPKLTVDLEFEGYNPFLIPEKFETEFKEVHDNYHNSYLFIEAVGSFENDRKSGYGHLGSNNSRFIVSELIKVRLIKK